jgi:hypothetical protein
MIQSDCMVENLIAMQQAVKEYGVYQSPSSPSGKAPPLAYEGAVEPPAWMTAPKVRPGVCFPREQKMRELPPVIGDAALAGRIWNDIEGLA